MRVRFCQPRFALLAAAGFLILPGFRLQAKADTLYLKNGRSIEGIINKEDDRDVDLEVGCGLVKFSKEQIESISRSSSSGAQLIKQGWAKEKEAQAARVREFREKQESLPKPVALGNQNGQMIVETTLNKKFKVNLVLDTGASVVILSAKTAARLGLDVSVPENKAKGVAAEFVLADGRKIVARSVILESVSVQGSEAQNVEAAVLPEQENSIIAGDGLLGMSFLKNFCFKIDQKNNNLILEKQP